MKKIILASLLMHLIFPFGMLAQSWKLVWSDEFNGKRINRKNWVFDTGTNDGWGNDELEYYTSRRENATVKNGNLLIIAKREEYDSNDYTSARLKTLGLQRWTYGKIEARIKLPAQQGLWPAFWMLGENIKTAGFPYCGEIDVMESVNTDTGIYGTMHWSNRNRLANNGGSITVKNKNEYHVYSVEWDSNFIKWSVDDTIYWEGVVKDNINQTQAFHKPFFILLNLAVGGEWPGNPTPQSNFPDTMFVDYVRVYQMKKAKDN